MLGNLSGPTVQEFGDSVVAQMKLISVLQIDYSRQRNDPLYTRLVRRQAERELASGRVSHNHDSFPITPIFSPIIFLARRMLHQKLVGRANIGERSGPASAGVADAPVFQVRRG